MLIQVRLKNFRQHRELTVDFTKGLNVIRGANERGKSTILEAVCYALGGISTCRTSLEETVSWGEPVTSLKVELDIEIEGTAYRVRRSKSGAEVRYGDGATVTGQKEVTAFFGRLFGVDFANISSLLLAGQGDIRGALAKGSAKTAALIEDLANFDVIDRVVTLIGERLLTGSPAPFEEKIGRLLPELAACEAALADVPDTLEQETELAVLEPQLADLEAQANDIVEQTGPLTAERDRLQALAAEQRQLQDRATALEAQADREGLALEALKDEEPAPPDAARMAQVQTLLASAAEVARRRQARAEIQAIQYPEISWDEPLESFRKEVARNTAELARVRKALADLAAKAASRRAQRITQTSCGLCAKDLSNVPEVVAKNAAIDAELASLAADEEDLKAREFEANSYADLYSGIAAQQTYMERQAARYGDLVAIDQSWTPWRLSWAGGDLPAEDDGAVLRAELAQLQAAEKAVTVWQTRLAEQRRRVFDQLAPEVFRANQAAMDKRFAGLAEKTTATLAQLEDLNGAYNAVIGRVYEMKEAVSELRATIQVKRAAYDTAVNKVQNVRDALEEAQHDLDKVNFNNALLKRVRAARPVIANKLWTMTLSSISRYFSQMRGEESAVTKDSDGFKVNGKPIEALSGSTLDILGLAVRLSLVRFFLPHAPFLILDEPSAACDVARTEAMMGFLVGAGFDQLLIVTHEEMSEQVADQLIEI